ncbi:MAG: hypothetical protein QXP27_03280 [Candidatus Methanomethyliaceae archaeon]
MNSKDQIESKRLRSLILKNPIPPFVFYSIVLGCSVAVTWAYVCSETGIYWWDYANYQNIAHAVISEFRRSPWKAVQFIAKSRANNYNAIFTIPLLPLLLLFGESRISFEIGLVIAYLFPFMLIMGGIASRVISAQGCLIRWLTVVMTFLIPTLWAPVLRGYPDIGAAACIAMAVFLNLDDQSDSKKIYSKVLSGAVLALAPLLRRHFVYSVIAFYLAWLIASMSYSMMCCSKTRERAAKFLKNILWLGLIGFVMMLIMGLIGGPFIRLVMTTNFNLLYASYLQPWHLVLARFAASYGLITFGLGVLGCAIGVCCLRTWAAQFAFNFAIVSALVWIFGGRQLGNHYSLHFAPLVIQGLIALGYMIYKNFKTSVLRRLASVLAAAFFMVNFLSGLTMVDPFRASTWRRLFAENWPPIQRNDVAQLVQMVVDLRALTSKEDVVYVVASSPVLNSDLIANVERTVYGWANSRLNLISYDVDSKHPYPLEALLKAQIVVIAAPLQLHLDPEQQGTVRSVFDLFTNHLYLSQDFALLSQRYKLDRGVTVYLYRRIRSTQPDVAFQTLRFIQTYIRQRPIVQPGWIILSPASSMIIHANSPCRYSIELPSGVIGNRPSPTVLFIGPWTQPPSVEVSVQFPFNQNYPYIKIFGWDREGRTWHVCSHQFYSIGDGAGTHQFHCASQVPLEALALSIDIDNGSSNGMVAMTSALQILLEIIPCPETKP